MRWRRRDVVSPVVGLVEAVCDAIAAGDEHALAVVNPWLWIRVQGAALRAQAALREDDPQRRRQLRAAQDGRCPEGLWDHVHHRAAGARHAALDAWERGAAYVFEEPEVSTASLAA